MAKKSVKKKIKALIRPKKAGLNPKAFGIALGIICAASMVLFSLVVIFMGTGQELMRLTELFYFGYGTTVTGILLGAIYGFVDGFIGGFIFAWIYNKLI